MTTKLIKLHEVTRITSLSRSTIAPQQSRCLRSKVLIRDNPGSSGMTPGCDSPRGQRLTGIGRHNCGARLLIHEIPFKRRFLGVFGCQNGGDFSEVSTYGDTEGGSAARWES